jgi:hypothetical protein
MLKFNWLRPELSCDEFQGAKIPKSKNFVS